MHAERIGFEHWIARKPGSSDVEHVIVAEELDDYRARGWIVRGPYVPAEAVDPSPAMLREGARALDLWSDESLREKIDSYRMAGLVWKAMVNANAA